ncbi:glycosyltransferase [Yoonia maritima]|uniref:glycosyltransferase n=1 Tax=Yoonia maritima TaxID=1435347 RepID=UPI003735683D
MSKKSNLGKVSGTKSSTSKDSNLMATEQKISTPSHNPMLTIIACVHAAAESDVIDRTLYSSLFKDGYSETEIVVVDSSPDAAARKAIEEIVTSFGGVYVTDIDATTKYGLARARNVGAAKASGEYLLFVDVDLIAPKDFMKSIYTFIQSGRLAKAENYFSIIPVVYLKPLPSSSTISDLRKSRFQDLIHSPLSESVDTIQVVNSTILIRKSFFTLLGGQHEGFRGWGMEDWHFLWKLMSFPQPFPGVSSATGFHRKTSESVNTLKSWRDVAWFIGNEALENGLYLFHVDHERRGWRPFYSKNEKRFDLLVKNGIIFEKNATLKSGKKYKVYSDDPSVANGLLYPPESVVTVSKPTEINIQNRSFINGDDTGRTVIGATNPDKLFYETFDGLTSHKKDFDFVYPTASPEVMFYFSYLDGDLVSPAPIESSFQDLVSKFSSLESAEMNAEIFRNSGWRKDKSLPLFILTEDIAEVMAGNSIGTSLFGMPPAQFRSLMNALFPLMGEDKAVMVYDKLSIGENFQFPAKNVFSVNDQALECMIESADVIITQSPRYALQAAIAGKPVITTGTLFETILPSLQVSQSLAEIFDFIEKPSESIPVISQVEIENALMSSCLSVADRGDAPTVANLVDKDGSPRVLFEQVVQPGYQKRFVFSDQVDNPSVFAWLYPHIDQTLGNNMHLQVSNDYYARSAVKPRLKAKQTKHRATPPSQDFQPRFPSSPTQRQKMYRRVSNESKLKRKMAKFRRAPRQFFADSSNPILRPVRFLFPKG